MVRVNRTLREEVTFEFTVRGRTDKGGRDRSNLENLGSRGSAWFVVPFLHAYLASSWRCPSPFFPLYFELPHSVSTPSPSMAGGPRSPPEEVLPVGRSLGFK